MELDLTKKEDVIRLMSSSKSEKEWDNNCDKVIEANNGYPAFWYTEIILSGVAQKSQFNWITLSN